ncbi:uncharacterized protein LOC130743644 [Lotus japonicus]|uniref:uncharacterized protein LOC130743644 n=1 Tax=Lotus japonicus TaxID=34305 RepID=UPI0025894199|nr:uncharacterized protein LOC130743644 [Lotus japonicus]
MSLSSELRKVDAQAMLGLAFGVQNGFLSVVADGKLVMASVVDSLFWPGAIDGEYSCKLGYSFIRDHDARSLLAGSLTASPFPSNMWRTFWKSKVLPRCKDLTWRVCCSLLLVRYSLWRKDLEAMARWQATSYALWEARNKAIFQKQAFDCETVLKRAALLDPMETAPENHGVEGAVQPACWSRPPRGTFKINFDGSWKENSASGLGMVARNHDGPVLAAAAVVVERPSSVVEAEALALR